MELYCPNQALAEVDRRASLLVLLATLGVMLALWEFPIAFLGLIVAVLFLAGVYHLPELGLAVLVNGLYLVGYFWRGLEVTYLVTPLAVIICGLGLVHYTFNNGLRWRFGIPVGLVLLIGLLLFIGILYSPLPWAGSVKAGMYLTLNLVVFLGTTLFTGDADRLKNLLRLIAISGFVIGLIALARTMSVGMESISRLTLPGQNPIWFARGLGMSLLATLFLLELAQRRHQRFILAAFILLFFFLLYLTASRGPFLSLLIVLFIYFFILRWKKLNLLKALSLLILAFFSLRVFISLAPGEIWNRMLSLLSGFDLTTFLRLRAYGAARDLFLENPLAGVGTGGFGHYNLLTYPHNIFLELASELGIWGLAALLFMILYTTYLAIRLLKSQTASALELSLGRAFFAIFIFALINSQFSGDISSNYELWFASAGIWALHKGNCKVLNGV